MSEEPDYETLASLLKQRNKENKLLQKKVSKLEERYVSKHKESADVQEQNQSLMGFLQQVLDRHLSQDQVTPQRLESLWGSKQEEQKRLMRSITENANEQTQKVTAELNRVKEELKAKESELKEFQALEEQCQEFKSQIAELRAENEYLEKQLDNFRVENAKLRAKQDEISKAKTNNLLAALEQRPPDHSEDVTKLQKQLVDAQNRISHLETELKTRENQEEKEAETQRYIEEILDQKSRQETELLEMKQHMDSIKQEFKEHRRKAQQLLLEKEQSLDRLKGKLKDLENTSSEDQQITALKLRISELEKAQSKENVNLEYLKNIVMKFMEYMYTGNLKEANTLGYVVYTVLEFTPEEIEVVKSAKESNKLFTKVANLIYNKNPGVGLSHNTLHTLEGRRRVNFSSESSRFLDSSQLDSSNLRF